MQMEFHISQHDLANTVYFYRFKLVFIGKLNFAVNGELSRLFISLDMKKYEFGGRLYFLPAELWFMVHFIHTIYRLKIERSVK